MAKFVFYNKETNTFEFTEFTMELTEDFKFELILKDDNKEVGSESVTYAFTIKCTYCG